MIAVGIGLSTLGFLSNQILTSPRIYYAMAEDGDFFKSLAWLHPKTGAPIVAIALPARAGDRHYAGCDRVRSPARGYQSILDSVTAIDFVFFALAALAVFVFARATKRPRRTATFACRAIRIPPPASASSAAVVGYTVYAYPGDTVPCIAILFSGVPAYYLWLRYKLARPNA